MRSRLSCFLGKRFVGNTQTGDMGRRGDRPRGSSDFIGFYRSPPSRAAKMATLPVRATSLKLLTPAY